MDILDIVIILSYQYHRHNYEVPYTSSDITIIRYQIYQLNTLNECVTNFYIEILDISIYSSDILHKQYIVIARERVCCGYGYGRDKRIDISNISIYQKYMIYIVTHYKIVNSYGSHAIDYDITVCDKKSVLYLRYGYDKRFNIPNISIYPVQ